MIPHTSEHAVLTAWDFAARLAKSYSLYRSPFHHCLFCKTFPEGCDQVLSFYYTLLDSSLYSRWANHIPQFLTHLWLLSVQDPSFVSSASLPDFHSPFLLYSEHALQSDRYIYTHTQTYVHSLKMHTLIKCHFVFQLTQMHGAVHLYRALPINLVLALNSYRVFRSL